MKITKLLENIDSGSGDKHQMEIVKQLVDIINKGEYDIDVYSTEENKFYDSTVSINLRFWVHEDE